MLTPRYRAQRLRPAHREVLRLQPGNEDIDDSAYGIRDTVAKTMVDRWGVPDPMYWAVNYQVARMRAHDLNLYAAESAD